MNELLRPVSQKYHLQPANDKTSEGRASETTSTKRESIANVSSRASALEVLRDDPSYESLVSVLRFLAGRDAHQLRDSGPEQAQIVRTLVTEIVPNYWEILRDEFKSPSRGEEGGKRNPMELLLKCLRGITGINAILAYLRALIAEAQVNGDRQKATTHHQSLTITLDLLNEVLSGDETVSKMWPPSTASNGSATKARMLSQEFAIILGGGRVISLVAEGLTLNSDAEVETRSGWLADRAEYCRWLSRNIVTWCRGGLSADDRKVCSELLAKSLKLGHSEIVVKLLVSNLLVSTNSTDAFHDVFEGLPQLEKKSFLFHVIKQLTNDYLRHIEDGIIGAQAHDALISASCALILSIIKEESLLRSQLVLWLTSPYGAGVGDSIGIRRAVVCAVAQNKEAIISVLEKALIQFGDQLYIKHTPLIQQEAHSQVLLLAAAYVRVLSPIKINILLKSSPWLNAISNRLAASQGRARFLGMVVGETISSFVDGDKRLDFHMDETRSPEGLWYKSLAETREAPGSIHLLREHQPAKPSAPQSSLRKDKIPASPRKPATPNRPTGFVIEEIEDDIDHTDFVPYSKPDSDAEDSDDDAELVTRQRPKAPVYIRDLIVYLRDIENYDRQRLAIQTAPVLIRRKSNHGTEVKDHVEELATLLIGLQDKFELEDFHELRLQGMIAVTVAWPEKMGPWFSRTFFEGDYSLAQRAVVLTVIGLTARELAGFETSSFVSKSSFPSKRLPERMENLYIGQRSSSNGLEPPGSSNLRPLPANVLDSVTQSLQSDFMAPLAATAADKATGPDALKLSTFTSRVHANPQSQVIKSTQKPRKRAIPNTTAQLIATYFFSPLTVRFQYVIRSPVGRASNIAFQPFLLSLFLKTVALLIHAAGPSTLALPEMTNELLGLLLGPSVRAHCIGDLGLMHAALFALLSLLEVNENRMQDLFRDCAKDVIELQEWVARVFEETRGGDDIRIGGTDNHADGTGQERGEEAQVKMLAAGILIRLRDGMDKYRALLVGNMIG